MLRRENWELSLTEAGTREAGAGRAGARILDVLQEYKETFSDVSDDELLAYVCAAEAAGPAARERLRPRMECLVMSLPRKEKISCGRAAELLGEGYRSVLKKAGGARIRPLGA